MSVFDFSDVCLLKYFLIATFFGRCGTSCSAGICCNRCGDDGENGHGASRDGSDKCSFSQPAFILSVFHTYQEVMEGRRHLSLSLPRQMCVVNVRFDKQVQPQVRLGFYWALYRGIVQVQGHITLFVEQAQRLQITLVNAPPRWPVVTRRKAAALF